MRRCWSSRGTALTRRLCDAEAEVVGQPGVEAEARADKLGSDFPGPSLRDPDKADSDVTQDGGYRGRAPDQARAQHLRRPASDRDRHDGPYRYVRGFNPAALAALVLAVLPNVLGFAHEAGFVAEVRPVWDQIYAYAWFVGFLLGGGLYWLLMRVTSSPPSPPQQGQTP